MLRTALQTGVGCLPRRAASGGAVSSAQAGRRALSSLQEALVKVTFVDAEGDRETVSALPGQNIFEVAEKHEIALDGPCRGKAGAVQSRNSESWTEDLFGQGPVCASCHVMLTKEFTEKIEPPLDSEISLLERKGELYAPGSSRLGCQIKLSRDLDGITVFIPDGPPVG
ncbi:conserved unknown protein [Ectocarpus siliculosus]|uniref:2Fe-2S ferredoxin-type domain-containing protein n=1 Tax=Ectocarpus siliculosus TaxID=2880 RepID=D7FRQ2_ECTSI|nr:conserved unknown protein [Ectocarpus siliculosus]|eukprot:CBJ30843.1 conserved unknown protein [Ectocarpus siliculosus]